ncbi:hypothetical protein [Yinghuangia seranimata]|uniref:hypothetical protein n=1 Tax=Yinghuangia seranimata TaxID=408067 RepID=UPI00248AB1C4|nr:hypothetical protein [Yinghuangia seranimata]MDI2127539.1 hypothetical protein [Yinghuangia seranimata]
MASTHSGTTSGSADPDTGREDGYGAIAAAFLAAPAAAVVLGINTVLCEASPDVKEWMAWNHDVGALSGKSLIATIAYVAAWPLLHLGFRRRGADPGRIMALGVALVVAALVLTFPPFFGLFAADE